MLRKRLIYAVETFGGLDSIDANLYVNNVYVDRSSIYAVNYAAVYAANRSGLKT